MIMVFIREVMIVKDEQKVEMQCFAFLISANRFKVFQCELFYNIISMLRWYKS